MLGYISSTRKKSCQACVKSKRRCDLGYPICKRCFSKGLDCRYPNAKVCGAAVVVRQTTPDLIVPATQFVDDAVLGSTKLPLPPPPPLPQDPVATLDPELLHGAEASSSDSSSPEIIPHDDLDVRVLEGLLPQIWEPRIMNREQISTVVNELCTFIPSMAFTGYTLFINESLYDRWRPQAYQDVVSLSALYMMKTGKNTPILADSIDAKITQLIASYGSWSLTEHLAAVQALIIYQIIRLYDPSLNLQAHAAKQNKLLEFWTATLWKRSFNEPDRLSSTYESWIFQESLRRTVLMSTFLRCSWAAVTKNGQAELVPVLAKLPLTRDQRLWECKEQEWLTLAPYAQKSLVAYGDFSFAWKPHVDCVDELTEFEKLLLAACRGGDDPRLLAAA